MDVRRARDIPRLMRFAAIRDLASMAHATRRGPLKRTLHGETLGIHRTSLLTQQWHAMRPWKYRLPNAEAISHPASECTTVGHGHAWMYDTRGILRASCGSRPIVIWPAWRMPHDVVR